MVKIKGITEMDDTKERKVEHEGMGNENKEGMDRVNAKNDISSIIDSYFNNKRKGIRLFNYVTGIYPRSSTLIAATRKLAMDDPKLRELFIRGKRSWINAQKRVGLSYIADPMLNWDDIFRPFSEVNGIELGALNRFFETNTFYRRLIIKDELKGYGNVVVKHLALDLIDEPSGNNNRRSNNNGNRKGVIKYKKVACIPDPYTFSYMNENRYYKSDEDYILAVADMLNAEARALDDNGIDIIHMNAPAIAYNVSNDIYVDLSLVKQAVEKVKSNVKSKVYLYLYFGNVSNIFDKLLDIKVDGIGIDVTSTKITSVMDYSIDKDLVIGIVDSMNTKLEDVRSTASALDFILNKIDAKSIVLTVSNSLEFLPYRFAMKKLSILDKITRLLKAKQDGIII